jgi:hypothetical protein
MELDHIEIKIHANSVADRGGSSNDCPYLEGGIQRDLWLNYFYKRIMWLEGELSE